MNRSNHVFVFTKILASFLICISLICISLSTLTLSSSALGSETNAKIENENLHVKDYYSFSAPILTKIKPFIAKGEETSNHGTDKLKLYPMKLWSEDVEESLVSPIMLRAFHFLKSDLDFSSIDQIKIEDLLEESSRLSFSIDEIDKSTLSAGQITRLYLLEMIARTNVKHPFLAQTLLNLVPRLESYVQITDLNKDSKKKTSPLNASASIAQNKVLESFRMSRVSQGFFAEQFKINFTLTPWWFQNAGRFEKGQFIVSKSTLESMTYKEQAIFKFYLLLRLSSTMHDSFLIQGLVGYILEFEHWNNLPPDEAVSLVNRVLNFDLQTVPQSWKRNLLKNHDAEFFIKDELPKNRSCGWIKKFNDEKVIEQLKPLDKKQASFPALDLSNFAFYQFRPDKEVKTDSPSKSFFLSLTKPNEKVVEDLRNEFEDNYVTRLFSNSFQISQFLPHDSSPKILTKACLKKVNGNIFIDWLELTENTMLDPSSFDLYWEYFEHQVKYEVLDVLVSEKQIEVASLMTEKYNFLEQPVKGMKLSDYLEKLKSWDEKISSLNSEIIDERSKFSEEKGYMAYPPEVFSGEPLEVGIGLKISPQRSLPGALWKFENPSIISNPLR